MDLHKTHTTWFAALRRLVDTEEWFFITPIHKQKKGFNVHGGLNVELYILLWHHNWVKDIEADNYSSAHMAFQ